MMWVDDTLCTFQFTPTDATLATLFTGMLMGWLLRTAIVLAINR